MCLMDNEQYSWAQGVVQLGIYVLPICWHFHGIGWVLWCDGVHSCAHSSASVKWHQLYKYQHGGMLPYSNGVTLEAMVKNWRSSGAVEAHSSVSLLNEKEARSWGFNLRKMDKWCFFWHRETHCWWRCCIRCWITISRIIPGRKIASVIASKFPFARASWST